MIERCFWMLSLRGVTVNSDGTVEKRSQMLAFADEAEEAIDGLLSPWGINSAKLSSNLDNYINHTGITPWALALYKKEFRLAGHAASLRKSRKDYVFSNYSLVKKPRSLEENEVPSFSFLVIYNKSALADSAAQSPLFDAAWDLFKYKSEERMWVCLPVSPPEDWVSATSVGDDELYRKLAAGR
jgi:hypothetical protein